jgi:hypothetical protein
VNQSHRIPPDAQSAEDIGDLGPDGVKLRTIASPDFPRVKPDHAKPMNGRTET